MRGFMRGFDNRIIAHAVRTQRYKQYSGGSVVAIPEGQNFRQKLQALVMWSPFFSGSSLHMAYYRIYAMISVTIVQSYITSLLPSVLLQVRSMSNNANSNKQVIIFMVRLGAMVIMILSYEPSISLHIQMQLM